jgi:hypothetical protein
VDTDVTLLFNNIDSNNIPIAMKIVNMQVIGSRIKWVDNGYSPIVMFHEGAGTGDKAATV